MKKLTALLFSALIILLVGCRTGTRVETPSPHPPTPAQEPSGEYEYTQPEPENYVSVTPMIALTFDDGPWVYTDHILDLLEQHNARATFFVLGYRVEWRPGTVTRAVDMGSEIASHTWTHLDLTRLSDEEIIYQIQAASAVIESVIGYSPRIYRPPFGLTTDRVQQISAHLGYSIVNWTLDTLDWRYRDADTIYNAIMSTVQSGDVILLHDIYPSTVQAMERVIPSLIAEGYQLVTVSELLTYFYGELEPGVVYGRLTEPELASN